MSFRNLNLFNKSDVLIAKSIELGLLLVVIDACIHHLRNHVSILTKNTGELLLKKLSLRIEFKGLGMILSTFLDEVCSIEGLSILAEKLAAG